MAKITNKTYWPIILPNGMVIKRGETIACENGEIRNASNEGRISALLAVADIEVEYDPDPAPEAPLSEPETDVIKAEAETVKTSKKGA